MWTRAAFSLAIGALTLALAACGDDGGRRGADASSETDTGADAARAVDGADGADDTTEPPALPHPLFGYRGEIALLETVSPGSHDVLGAVSAHVEAGLRPELYERAGAVGACELWVAVNASCGETGCESGEVCDRTGTCAALPAGASVGDFRVTGTKESFSATYEGLGLYTVAPGSVPNLFDAGDPITVTVDGAGATPGATLALRGVGELDDDFGSVDLVDGEDATITWAPARDGSKVELILQLGWHGSPPAATLLCGADDAAGAVVIDRRLVEGFPYFGGIGLFQVPSWIQRVHRAVLPSPAGPVAGFAGSRQAVGVTHRPSR